MRYLLIFLLYPLSMNACNLGCQHKLQPVRDTISVSLGSRTVHLIKSTYGQAQPYLFLQLHDNEATGEEAAIQFLQEKGGVLLTIENAGERNLSFDIGTQRYTFDPNRIFTPVGLRATLQRFGNSSPEAISAVEGLAQTILQQLPDSLLIVAIHNNTDEAFSTLSYRDDTTYQRDAAAVFVAPQHDIDDFFLTTDKTIYDDLVRLNYNVVLQDNTGAADDGSLSVYFGKKGVRYVNVEAQHGNLAVQRKMIEDLLLQVIRIY